MSSEYLTNPKDISFPGEGVVYPAGTLLRATGQNGKLMRVVGRVGGQRRKRWLPIQMTRPLPEPPDAM